MTFLRTLALGGAVLLASCEREPPTGEQHAEYHARVKTIESEAARLAGHQWAGTYHQGGIFVSNTLSVAPEAGMAYREVGCLGVYDLSWGTIVARGEVLLLQPELRPWYWIPEELIVVPWGERVYLVEPEELESFATDAQTGREPRTSALGDYLLRDGDWDRPVSGAPENSMCATLLFGGLAADDPVAAVVGLFHQHDVVLLGESPHRGRRIHAFYERLLAEPAFVRLVDDVLVEFGNARYQELMDRYLLELGDVPREELAHAWRDTTQLTVWDSPVYEAFFAYVRKLNEGLERGQRMRVLLGDPPIEWEKVQEPEQLQRWFDREASYHSILEREVLAKRRTALVLIGSSHLFERNPSAGFSETAIDDAWLGQLLAASHPGRTCTVYPFFGRAPLQAFEGVSAWEPPLLVNLAAGSLADAPFGLIAPQLSVRRVMDGVTTWVPLEPEEWPAMRVMVDSLLYLGEESEDEAIEASVETYLDSRYTDELMRRARLLDAFFGFENFVPSIEELLPKAR